MYPDIVKILKIPANNLEEINGYLSKGAILIGQNTVATSEISSEISYFYIGLLNSSQ